MKHFAFAVAMAAAVPGIAAAQTAADPADPSTSVPAPAYRSVFQDQPAGVEEEQVDWKQANADVAQFPRGHADYVKWEEQQAGQADARQPAAGAAPPAAPAPAAAPAARPKGHGHH